MVRYNYDIFGVITAVKNGSNQTITDTTSIAFLNPLRYRGYVYDDETGLYYLRSRYYDPVTGRFINADIYFDTGTFTPLSTNMFSYCENMPNSRIDSIGEWYEDLDDYNAFLTQEKRKIKKLESRPKNTRWNDLRDGYKAAYASFLGEYNSAMEHYRINKQYVFRNYIFSQYQYSWYKNIKMGKAGNLQDNGCGIIAIYNILMRIAGRASLAQIILEAELNKMLLFQGAWGVDFDAIQSYLNAHHIRHRKVTNYSDFKKSMCNYSSAIVYIKNSGFLNLSRHYYVVYRLSHGRYLSLNQYGSPYELRNTDIKSISDFRGAYLIM